jgi:hypothetical protein
MDPLAMKETLKQHAEDGRGVQLVDASSPCRGIFSSPGVKFGIKWADSEEI